MPGGWTLSMAWVPMLCGQTWAGAAAHFIGMWAVMMAAMMLPSLVPVLWRFGAALQELGVPRRAGLVALAGAAYLSVWTAIGLLVFAAGAAFAQALMQVPTMAQAVPVAGAMVVLLAGAFQFTASKAHHLACCRPGVWHEARVPSTAAMAWRYGVRLGLRCSRACAGLTAILLVIGVMDLWAMAFVAAAITAERLAPPGARVAWVVGAVSVVTGVVLMVRPAWLL
ncbi:MAG TPA: DUF2182 domain-containing protein [Ramlibacter sp.]|nr:DUF2182 domain-containing protein [Ramlibacter sp.]